MRRLTTLAAIIALPTILHAQITINQGNYSSWQPVTDSLRSVTGLSGLITGSNKDWDFTTASYGSSNIYVSRGAGTNAQMPNANYYTNIFYQFGLGLTIDSKTWDANSATGIVNYGEQITQRQGISLGTVTQTPTDSLVFPVQTVLYSQPQRLLQFPAAFGTTWVSDFNYQTNFILDIPNYGFLQAPGYRKTYVTHTDSVSGWGRINVKRQDGSNSGWINVLQVKTTIQYIDSFYANGAPIPDLLLNSANLEQGGELYVYRVSYFRPGEVTPLLQVDYSDASWTTVSGALLHNQRLFASSLPSVSIDQVSLFPNPVTNRTVYVTTPAATRYLGYSLVNSLGQQVQNGQLTNTTSGTASILLGENVTPGIYFVQFKDGNQILGTKAILIN